MKRLILTGLMIGATAGAFAQGIVNLDNNANSNPSPSASTGGLFFDLVGAGPATAATGTWNVSFLGGSSAGTLAVLHTFLISDPNNGGAVLGNGTFTDLSGNSYPVTGVASGGTATFNIQAWRGTASSFAAAQAANAASGQTGDFTMAVGGGNVPPPDFTVMPAVVMSAVPEPSTFALAGLGGAALLIFRRRK